MYDPAKMIIKIHKGPDGRRVIAVCDHDIIGKKFEEGRLQLDLTSSFYKGEEKAEKDLIDEIRKGSCVLNMVGKKSIEFCKKKGFIEKGHIIKVKGVPHAQAVIVLGD